MRGMLRQQEEPGHNQETAAHNPYRGPPPRLFVLFVIHGIHSVQDTSAEEVVERYEDPGDVPAPDEAFDEAQEKALPAQQFESRQEDRKRPVLYGETRQQQIARYANHVADHEKRTEAQSQPRDTQRGHSSFAGRCPRRGLHLTHVSLLPSGIVTSSPWDPSAARRRFSSARR